MLEFRFRFAVALAFSSFALAAGAQPAFVARTDAVATGLGQPFALAVGDFVNPGDGLLDLAITWQRENAITLLENDGNGNFSLAKRLDAPPRPGMGGPPDEESNVGAKPTAILAIDLDGDGIRDDIAGCNEGISRFFAYENGGGTWLPTDPDAIRAHGRAATVGHWGSSTRPTDECEDLFTATQNGAVNIAVSECDGSGEFEIVTRFFHAAGVGVQTDIEVGDFIELGDDNGQVDVLTIDNLLQQIVIWPGDPTLDVNLRVGVPPDPTTLVFQPVLVGPEPATPVQAIAEDWDADGQLDLLVLVEEGYVLWYRGTGDPADNGFEEPLVTDLAGPLSETTRQPTRFSAMAYEDLMGADGASGPDGIRDLVIADAGRSSDEGEGFNWLWLVPGIAPTAGLDEPPAFDVGLQSHYAAPDLAPLRPGSLVVADFDGGAPDVLLLAFDSSTITLFRNDGAGGLDAARSFAAGAQDVRSIAGRELAGLAPDLVFAAREGEGIGVLPGDGTGRLIEPGQLAESSGEALVDEVKLLELDGDSIPDALVTSIDEHLLYRGMADGSYAAPELLSDGPLALSGVSRAGNLGPGGGSSTVDLAIFSPALGNTTLEIWLGDGTGGFERTQEVPGINGYSAHAVGAFIAGTGLDSIVVAGETDAFSSPPLLHLLTADGSGTYSVTATVGFPPPFDSFPSPVEVLVPGDFDANGQLDVVAILGGGESFLFASTGSELIAPADFFSVGGSPRAGIAENIGGDGYPELIVANRDSVTVLPNDAAGFGAPLVLPSNIDNVSVAALDLDGDDRAEIVAGSQRTNDVTVFRNVSVGPFVVIGGPGPGGGCCRYSWPLVAGATYSVVRGDLTALWEDRSLPLAMATESPCAATGISATHWEDSGPSPEPTGSWPPLAFYLVRCEGDDCPEGGFGDDANELQRYPTDPCP